MPRRTLCALIRRPAPGFRDRLRASARTGTSDGEGPPPLAAPDAIALPLLAQPIIAVLAGAAFGIGAVLVSRLASRLVTPADPALGFAKVAVVMFARLLLTLAALAVYFVLAPRGLAFFGVTLVLSFIVSLGFEAFRPARTVTPLGPSS